jgi:hypothetical protein
VKRRLKTKKTNFKKIEVLIVSFFALVGFTGFLTIILKDKSPIQIPRIAKLVEKKNTIENELSQTETVEGDTESNNVQYENMPSDFNKQLTEELFTHEEARTVNQLLIKSSLSKELTEVISKNLQRSIMIDKENGKNILEIEIFDSVMRKKEESPKASKDYSAEKEQADDDLIVLQFSLFDKQTKNKILEFGITTKEKFIR